MLAAQPRAWLLAVVLIAGIAGLTACGPTNDRSASGVLAADATSAEAASEQPAVGVVAEAYGVLPDGATVTKYTLRNRDGMRLALIDYGARIIALDVPDRAGKLANVVLYRDSLADYAANDPYFGATVGRFANRIAGGRFTLDGHDYALPTNNGPNHLHGGTKGFDKLVWTGEIPNAGEPRVVFRLTSPDGDQGYPGELKATVVYSLAPTNEMTIDYTAITDKPTVVNLANHAYWNLTGQGDILGHELTINADRYLPVDATLIPQGPPQAVRGTPMDFTQPTAIGAHLGEVAGGYDHCYVLNKPQPGAMTSALRLVDPASGRSLQIDTTEPAMQFYSGNFLDGSIGAGGTMYPQHAAMCLESQHYPDSPNRPDFPSAVLRPGETYRQTTVYKFGVEP